MPDWTHKHSSRPLLAFTLTVVISAALLPEYQAYSAQTRIHPTAGSIPEVSDPNFVLHASVEDGMGLGPDYFATKAIVDTVTIGAAEGEWYEMFGTIQDIAVDPSGQIFVLDQDLAEILIFNSDGTFLSSFGSPGAGPGELISPQRLALADSGKMAIVIGGRKTSIFEQDENGHFRYRNSFPKGALHGCAMNGYVYLLKPDRTGSSSIRKYTLRGEEIKSFGYAYESNHPSVTIFIAADGMLACNEEANAVSLVVRYIPVVFGYSGDGELLWRVRLADVVPPQLKQRGRGRIGFPPLSKGQSYLLESFVDFEGQFNLVYMTQVDDGQKIPLNNGQRTPIHLYQINPLTGRGHYAGDAPIVDAIHRDFIVQSRTSPYPLILILRLASD